MHHFSQTYHTNLKKSHYLILQVLAKIMWLEWQSITQSMLQPDHNKEVVHEKWMNMNMFCYCSTSSALGNTFFNVLLLWNQFSWNLVSGEYYCTVCFLSSTETFLKINNRNTFYVFLSMQLFIVVYTVQQQTLALKGP